MMFPISRGDEPGPGDPSSPVAGLELDTGQHGAGLLGRRRAIEEASVLRFDRGRVIAVRLYFDTTAIARQLLAAPAASSRLERVMAVAQRVRVRLRRARP